MKVLCDTNVALDYLLNREPFAEDATRLFYLASNGYIELYMSASAVTDIFYIVRKDLGDTDKTYATIRSFLDMLQISDVTSATIKQALLMKWTDFEDCVQFVSAQNASVDSIVTRDASGFKESGVKSYTPSELVSELAE
jgi:predicted nucleic acid-binding protein